MLRGEGETREQVIGDRGFERAAHVDPVIFAVSTFDEGGAIAGRFPGDQANDAASGVAAKQRALRTAQNFDVVEIQQIHDRAGRPTERNVIDIDRYTRLVDRLEVAEANAADAGRERRSPSCAEMIDRHVRRPLADVDHVSRAFHGKLFAGQGCYGQWGLLQVFLAEAGRDDDLANRPGIGLLGSRRRAGPK